MLFDSSLRRELARSFGATLVVILTIVLTMMLIRTLGLAAGGSVAPQDVALLLGYTALGHLPTMLSLSLFIAIVSTLTRMYRDSEMVIWFASGLGLGRFVKPVVRLGWPVLAAIAVLSLVVWPWGNRQVAELKERYEKRSDLSRVAPGQFQTSSDGRRVFFVERGEGDSVAGRNVFILQNENDRESVTTARSGQIEMTDGDRYLLLERGQRTDTDLKTHEKQLAQFDRYRVLAGERVATGAEYLPPRAQPTFELILRPSSRHLGELAWRLGLAFGGINLLLLGVGLAASNPRRGGSWNLMYALLAFVVYYNLLSLSQAWVSSGKLGLGACLLLIHGGTLLGALTLLWWRDRGSAAGGLRRLRPGR